MLLGFAATGMPDQARRARRPPGACGRFLFGVTAIEFVGELVFALTGSTWLAFAALLGVFFAATCRARST